MPICRQDFRVTSSATKSTCSQRLTRSQQRLRCRRLSRPPARAHAPASDRRWRSRMLAFTVEVSASLRMNLATRSGATRWPTTPRSRPSPRVGLSPGRSRRRALLHRDAGVQDASVHSSEDSGKGATSMPSMQPSCGLVQQFAALGGQRMGNAAHDAQGQRWSWRHRFYAQQIGIAGRLRKWRSTSGSSMCASDGDGVHEVGLQPVPGPHLIRDGTGNRPWWSCCRQPAPLNPHTRSAGHQSSHADPVALHAQRLDVVHRPDHELAGRHHDWRLGL